MDNPFVFDRYGRLEIHKRLMRKYEPYPIRMGDQWYIVHRYDDGVHMEPWECGTGPLANALFPDAQRISPALGGSPQVHLGQQVAAQSHLPREIEEMANVAARGKETGSWLVESAGSTTLADADGAGEGRAISPALNLPIHNLLHVYTAQGDHTPEECETGICARLTLDDCLNDLANVAYTEAHRESSLAMDRRDAMADMRLGFDPEFGA